MPLGFHCLMKSVGKLTNFDISQNKVPHLPENQVLLFSGKLNCMKISSKIAEIDTRVTFFLADKHKNYV